VSEPNAARPVFGFVLEQARGHVTYARNLREALAESSTVSPVFFEVPRAKDLAGRVPILRSNWAIRVSLDARRATRNAERTLSAVLFHTQEAALFARDLMLRVPAIISIDATPRQFESFGKSYGAGPRVRMPRWAADHLYRRAFNAAKLVVAFSDWAKASLLDDYGIDAAKVAVVPPGVDLGRFSPRLNEDSAKPAVRVLFVGGDFTRKGGDLLMDWAAKSRVRPFEVHVVTHDAVPTLPSVVVHRDIRNNSRELVELYRQSDIFVIPTRADFSPWAAVEAAACGLPIIATRVGGLPEIVEDGVSGYLADVGDASGFSALLDRLVADSDLRKRLGAQARRRSERLFDSRANCDRLIGLMRNLAASTSPQPTAYTA